MPYSGMSTCAVLALLTKWSASEPTLQQREDARWLMPQAARFFLQSLIAGSVRTPQMPWRSINVRFLRSWEIAWPARPPTPPDLVLQVDSVGVLNLQPWIDMNNGSPKELPKAWWRALLDAKVVAADTTKAPLVDFLINMVSIAKLKPLFAQLLTQAAQYIEVILLTILKKGFRDDFSVDPCGQGIRKSWMHGYRPARRATLQGKSPPAGSSWGSRPKDRVRCSRHRLLRQSTVTRPKHNDHTWSRARRYAIPGA